VPSFVSPSGFGENAVVVPPLFAARTEISSPLWIEGWGVIWITALKTPHHQWAQGGLGMIVKHRALSGRALWMRGMKTRHFRPTFFLTAWLDLGSCGLTTASKPDASHQQYDKVLVSCS
jgi:hypothetical protein